MAKVFAARKIRLSGSENVCKLRHQHIACGRALYLTWGNRFDGKASLRNWLGMSGPFGGKNSIWLDVTRSAESLKDSSARIRHATHRGIVAEVVVEPARKRTSENDLRAVRDASGRRIPPSRQCIFQHSNVPIPRLWIWISITSLTHLFTAK
jgi:hypothetical protein